MIQVLQANELMHFGIKGMKWGIRRYQNKDGTYTNAGKKRRGSEDYENAREYEKRGIKNLSNKELQQLVNRQNLEKQYKDLNPSLLKRGQKTAAAIVATAGTIGGLTAAAKKYGPTGKKIALAALGAVSTILEKR